MNEKIRRMLDQTNDIHLPIPLDEAEMAENRMVQKPVLENRLLDDMSSLENWCVIQNSALPALEKASRGEGRTDNLPNAAIELSSERAVTGQYSLKFTHPTNLPKFGDNPGRIYACPSAFRRFDREDWRAWNRLSAWVYPVAPGMKSITLRMQLHNDGEKKVPDRYERDGAHNMSLKGNCWNHVILEMPYLDRECVTGVSFDYDMVGHEPEAVDHVTWYIDKLELQKVKCDVFEGWIPADDRISFSGSGYQTGSVKLAVASEIQSGHFKVIETATGRIVLQKEIDTVQTKVGSFQVLNFTEVMDPGEYILVAGDHTTRAFAIGDDVWENSVWKMLNFFLILRCGYEVYGHHRACHTDMLLKHDGKAIVANGGWHDAGDLAQSLTNTTEATAALLSLAMALKDTGNDRLFIRVLEEAKWGLDYVIKMRFGDGYRGTYSSSSIWTDGVIGTEDDITTSASRSAYTNFDAAYAEALGAQAFKDTDPDYANYALKIAKEDFAFGMEIFEEHEAQRSDDFNGWGQFSVGDMIDVQVCPIGALAAAELYKLTQESAYTDHAKRFAEIVLACQQQELTDWDVPMAGFFYQDRKRDLIWHHNHMSYSYLPDLALRTLCESYPDDPDYMKWYSALALSGDYYKALSKYTFPYGVVPAGVYHIDELADHGQKVLCTHPGMVGYVAEAEKEKKLQAEGKLPEGYQPVSAGYAMEDLAAQYKVMVEKGFPLGKGYYVRVYPVWFSFRGNYNVLLSESKCMSSAALVRNDYALYTASQQQYEWIVGKNPMAQSTLYGEGYDYIQLYAVQPNQTVGAISVGMESHHDEDAPYWPQVNNATYKEVWVCPATKWMWCMADNLLPGKVRGYIKVEDSAPIRFVHLLNGKSYEVLPHTRTGFYEIDLPAGNYTMSYGEISRALTVINGRVYEIDGALYALEISTEEKDGSVILTVNASGEQDLPIEIKAENLSGVSGQTVLKMENGKGSVQLSGKVENPKKPYFGILIPNGNLGDKVEFTNSKF